MTQPAQPGPRVAIACGGTGGHLFPGLAVAENLERRGCSISLMISPKEVDQQAVRNVTGCDLVTLPASGLSPGRPIPFLLGFWKSFRVARRHFRQHRPIAVLGMGGFTAAPPVLAGRSVGATAFLHEANTIPGRANRMLAHFVEEAFVYFGETARRLAHQRVNVCGMPVRPQFQPHDADACRTILGLNPKMPTLLIMGGSQGASGINDLVSRTLSQPGLAELDFQIIHLAGSVEVDKVRQAHAASGRRAMVRPFLTEMELALGAATLAVCRAGASSLAELAAMRVPSILIPYPYASDDHQFHNARALEKAGAARLLLQNESTPEKLASMIFEMLGDVHLRAEMRDALSRWHTPHAAGMIADRILTVSGIRKPNSNAPADCADSPGNAGARTFQSASMGSTREADRKVRGPIDTFASPVSTAFQHHAIRVPIP